MNKKYQKPEMLVVNIEGEAMMAASGKVTDISMGFSSGVNDTEGCAKEVGGGLWDDEEED